VKHSSEPIAILVCPVEPYRAAKARAADVRGDLRTINFHPKHSPAVRMTFMRKLLQLIDIEGVYSQPIKTLPMPLD